MPNYYNPYNFYPMTYPGMSATVQPPMTYAMQQQSYSQGNTLKVMEWVEGEVGAKAYQKPPELPANQPIPLWDSTDTVIYLKSWSPVGIPNPIQKIHYEMPEVQNAMTLQSGAVNPEYVTKEDLKSLREDVQSLKEMMQSRRNQNGSGNYQNNNRGVNNNG